MPYVIIYLVIISSDNGWLIIWPQGISRTNIGSMIQLEFYTENNKIMANFPGVQVFYLTTRDLKSFTSLRVPGTHEPWSLWVSEHYWEWVPPLMFLFIGNLQMHPQDSGPWFNIKMSSYQYRKSHCGDKTVVRSSYLHDGISYTGKMSSLYWISPQVVSSHESFNVFMTKNMVISESLNHPSTRPRWIKSQFRWGKI